MIFPANALMTSKGAEETVEDKTFLVLSQTEFERTASK